MLELSAGKPAPVVRKTGHSLRRPSKLDMCIGKFEDSLRISTVVSGGSIG